LANFHSRLDARQSKQLIDLDYRSIFSEDMELNLPFKKRPEGPAKPGPQEIKKEIKEHAGDNLHMRCVENEENKNSSYQRRNRRTTAGGCERSQAMYGPLRMLPVPTVVQGEKGLLVGLTQVRSIRFAAERAADFRKKKITACRFEASERGRRRKNETAEEPGIALS